MTHLVLAVAFGLGLLSVVLVGAGFAGSSGIALAMTLVIGVVYLIGARELWRFRAATSGLVAALANIPQPLAGVGDWLGTVPTPLQNAVRLRIAGDRVALPGPALTPYLVGLLVMLGMLGTFLGMVLTFKGAVFALEGSTDLQAIRSALAAPIKGLGLAFGTSVAGVATSAMLGLLSAISRRERSDAARTLDRHLAAELLPFSHRYQQQQTFEAIQTQARALPTVVDQLQAMMDGLERRSQQLGTQLQEQQAQFHRETQHAYTDLAGSVAASLKDSLAAGARAAGESLTPVVTQALRELAQESRQLHECARADAQAHLQGLAAQFSATTGTVADTWKASLAQQARTGEVLVAARTASEAQWVAQQAARMEQLAGLWRSEISTLRADEAARGDAALSRLDLLRSDEAARGEAAVARLGILQAALATQLATLGVALEAPLTRMLQTASEVPQAAAGVITELRQEMSRLTERDNQALHERMQLVEHIGSLLQTLQQTAGEHRTAIDTLVASAGASLQRSGAQFSDTLATQLARAQEVATQVGGSAVELSSLGEAFGHGIQVFSASNERLTETLQRVEGAIGQSMARSDEQLAYYVAQAREVIDLSIASQQGIVEGLRRRDGRPAAQPAGGA